MYSAQCLRPKVNTTVSCSVYPGLCPSVLQLGGIQGSKFLAKSTPDLEQCCCRIYRVFQDHPATTITLEALQNRIST